MPIFVIHDPPLGRRKAASTTWLLVAGGQSTGVSLAIASASHLAPWREKLTCARASLPLPSSVTTTPSPTMPWNTD